MNVKDGNERVHCVCVCVCVCVLLWISVRHALQVKLLSFSGQVTLRLNWHAGRNWEKAQTHFWIMSQTTTPKQLFQIFF